MKLQNSRLETIHDDLEDIRSCVKSGNIHIALSSHVKQRSMLICVLSELTIDDVDAFITYLFRKIDEESGNVCVMFNKSDTFIDVAYKVCCLLKIRNNDIRISFPERTITLTQHNMIGSFAGEIQPPIIDQYISILQTMKDSA